MMNSPVTSTAARDARNSTVVSLGFTSAGMVCTLFSLFANVRSVPEKQCLVREGRSSVYQPQGSVPARVLEDVGQRVCKAVSFARRSIRVKRLHRPVNQQRSSYDI